MCNLFFSYIHTFIKKNEDLQVVKLQKNIKFDCLLRLKNFYTFAKFEYSQVVLELLFFFHLSFNIKISFRLLPYLNNRKKQNIYHCFYTIDNLFVNFPAMASNPIFSGQLFSNIEYFFLFLRFKPFNDFYCRYLKLGLFNASNVYVTKVSRIVFSMGSSDNKDLVLLKKFNNNLEFWNNFRFFSGVQKNLNKSHFYLSKRYWLDNISYVSLKGKRYGFPSTYQVFYLFCYRPKGLNEIRILESDQLDINKLDIFDVLLKYTPSFGAVYLKTPNFFHHTTSYQFHKWHWLASKSVKNIWSDKSLIPKFGLPICGSFISFIYHQNIEWNAQAQPLAPVIYSMEFRFWSKQSFYQKNLWLFLDEFFSKKGIRFWLQSFNQTSFRQFFRKYRVGFAGYNWRLLSLLFYFLNYSRLYLSTAIIMSIFIKKLIYVQVTQQLDRFLITVHNEKGHLFFTHTSRAKDSVLGSYLFKTKRDRLSRQAMTVNILKVVEFLRTFPPFHFFILRINGTACSSIVRQFVNSLRIEAYDVTRRFIGVQLMWRRSHSYLLRKRKVRRL